MEYYRQAAGYKNRRMRYLTYTICFNKFMNITIHENTTDIIHKRVEEKMNIQDAAVKNKIDRSQPTA